ncbi:MAG: EFR1 family ferrodoxin [Spirochaetes bacterium]|nr:EFR1 family ferrodoxin [Spirochaetota bacterium]
MQYSIRYFSGTGNTERAVGQVAELLRAAGHTVGCKSIEGLNSNEPDADICTADALILAFPTYAWMPPAMVIRYIAALQPGVGMPAGVLAVDGGGSFSAPSAAARLLARQGYSVSLAQSASYTENWTQFVNIPDSDTQDKLTIRGDAMARTFAQNLLAGHKEIQKSGIAGFLLSVIGRLYLLLGRRILGYTYIADHDCTSCGLCARTCPVQAIKLTGSAGMDGKALPRWNFSCEGCNRCINICPTRAINVSVARLLVFVLAAVGFSAAGLGLWQAVRPDWFLSGTGSVAANILAVTIIIATAHVLVFSVFAPLLLWLQRLPPFRRLFAASHTKKTRRYLAPSYRPAARSLSRPSAVSPAELE